MKTEFTKGLVEDALDCIRAFLLIEGSVADEIEVEGSFKDVSFVQPVAEGIDIRKVDSDAQGIVAKWVNKMKLAIRHDQGLLNAVLACNSRVEHRDGQDYVRVLLYESPLRIVHFFERAMELGIYDIARAGDKGDVTIVVEGGVGLIDEGAILEPDGFGRLQKVGSDTFKGMRFHPLTVGVPSEAWEVLASFGDTTRWELVRVRKSIVVLRPVS
ncbi:MAG: hypothetical protein OXI16_13720 [Chloroflexota bacterium]|nr:hypothetical protein [Chloroflexota bacterium]